MVERRDNITKVVFAAIDEFNSNLLEGERINKSLDEALIGSSGKVDSLGMINLIVAVEQKIEEEFKETVSLANDNAMSEQNSPFKTIGSLIDYVENLLKG
jgi:D-alanine--poly(phosphoribitol) ligase subunit 2